jgi:hypothetical protein
VPYIWANDPTNTLSNEEEGEHVCVGAVDSMISVQLELPPCPADIDSCSDNDYLTVCKDPFDETEELAAEHHEKKECKDAIQGLVSYVGILECAQKEECPENDDHSKEKNRKTSKTRL